MVLPNSTTGTGSNPRSRRSACDRCRAYKLRCQRDERPNEPCDRCSKAHLVCTTTYEQTSQRQNGCAHLPNGNDRGGGGRTENTRTGREQQQLGLPSPERPSPPPSPPSGQTSRRDSGYGSRLPSAILPSPAQREYLYTLDEVRGNAAATRWSTISPTTRRALEEAAGDAMPLDQEEQLGMDGMDFSMPGMGFDSGDLSSLIVDYSMDHDLSLSRTTDRRQGSDRDEGGRRFSYDDFTNADTTSASTSVPSWPTTRGGLSDGTIESMRDQDVEPGVLNAEEAARGSTPAKSHRDLLKLSLELMEDQEMMSAQAPWPPKPPITPNPLRCSSSVQQQPVNRMLDQASRLWEILKNLSAVGDTPRPRSGSRYENGSSNHSNGGGGGTSSNGTNRQGSIRPRSATAGNSYLAGNGNGSDLDSVAFPPPLPPHSYKHPDPVLIANLVTTYVCLLRSCRAVFARLHHALLMAPASEENSLISLPDLQFGNFPLENNVAIQVRVLIELTLGMLHRISNALGIGLADVIGGDSSSSPTPNEDAAHRMPFLSDPVAISIRQIILSQEMMQSSSQNVDPPPLARIIKNIRTLLERRKAKAKANKTP
ncbi:uncharacterized protein DNG_10232 [Cephalotrichum gorgonifer]|uniref:Zn(2)-C6 fungal-type domain-containing protein n=1 Tax=Cephalotrichum gorgonifer TaxID=2041049 RepID=A0AAE8N8T9_9PEZI|nr:uncharacterized protein DNG_10232 [Cephalotrichum gorgonifer]